MSAYTLDFYYYDACPFCGMVLDSIDQLGIAVNYCDITAKEEHLNKLVKDTGRRTVPCLFVNGKPMHESRDIMRWLEENQAELPKKS
jgi:glutaredoxin